jgi:uncharacterized membrane protein YfcA
MNSGIIRPMARPNLSYLKNLILTLFGVATGVFTGLTGISNAIVVMGGLGYLVGQRVTRAAQAALGAACAAGAGSFLSYQQNSDIAWSWVLPLLIGQTTGAVIAQLAGAKILSLTWVQRLGGVIVAAVGVLFLIPSMRDAMAAAGTQHIAPDAPLTVASVAVLVGMSLLVGLVGGIIRIGGVLLVPATIFFLHASAHVAQGTAIVVLVVAASPVILVQLVRPDEENSAKSWVPFGAFFGGLIGAFLSIPMAEPAALTAIGSACAAVGIIGMRAKR